ncbi:MAG TPA: hypothetical protein VHM23_22405 [Actinomycetota bacterium]|nr:hypothetical protein [Actinomycetota bacterium]
MRTRLRLGAAVSVGLGALLLATVLASPALAWHSNVDVESECLEDGQVHVTYTVKSWEEGHKAFVKVFYELNGEKTELPSGEFNDEQSEFSGEFDLPAGTTGMLSVTAVAFWKGGEKSKNSGSTELPDKCKPSDTTAPPTTVPPTSAPSSTAPPSSTVAPTTSLEATTTTAAAGAAPTTTTTGGQLPFTGASSGPMLLAGIALVGGGSLFLLLTRSGRNTAS